MITKHLFDQVDG